MRTLLAFLLCGVALAQSKPVGDGDESALREADQKIAGLQSELVEAQSVRARLGAMVEQAYLDDATCTPVLSDEYNARKGENWYFVRVYCPDRD